MRMQNRNGFSVIELIIVIVIFSIIASSIVNGFIQAIQTNAKAKEISDATILAQKYSDQIQAEGVNSIGWDTATWDNGATWVSAPIDNVQGNLALSLDGKAIKYETFNMPASETDKKRMYRVTCEQSTETEQNNQYTAGAMAQQGFRNYYDFSVNRLILTITKCTITETIPNSNVFEVKNETVFSQTLPNNDYSLVFFTDRIEVYNKYIDANGLVQEINSSDKIYTIDSTHPIDGDKPTGILKNVRLQNSNISAISHVSIYNTTESEVNAFYDKASGKVAPVMRCDTDVVLRDIANTSGIELTNVTGKTYTYKITVSKGNTSKTEDANSKRLAERFVNFLTKEKITP